MSLSLEQLKESVLIKFHREDKVAFVVGQNRMGIEVHFEEIEDINILNYIFEHGIEEKYAYEVEKHFGEIFQYVIGNGGDYEFADHTTLHSRFFITREEFKAMVKKAAEKTRYRDVYSVARVIQETYPDLFINIARGSGACTCEWHCGECDSPLRDE